MSIYMSTMIQAARLRPWALTALPVEARGKAVLFFGAGCGVVVL